MTEEELDAWDEWLKQTRHIPDWMRGRLFAIGRRGLALEQRLVELGVDPDHVLPSEGEMMPECKHGIPFDTECPKCAAPDNIAKLVERLRVKWMPGASNKTTITVLDRCNAERKEAADALERMRREENEACARLAEDRDVYGYVADIGCHDCFTRIAAAIRARVK